MNTKHTPGPWYTETESRKDPIIMGSVCNYSNIYAKAGSPWQKVHASKRFLVCQQFTVTREEYLEEQLANARLISAAPELLEAIKRLQRSNSKANWLFANQILVKVSGEGNGL